MGSRPADAVGSELLARGAPCHCGGSQNGGGTAVTLGKDDGESEKVDVNNDSLVLREVLKQIGELREIQEAKNEGGPLPRDAKSAV